MNAYSTYTTADYLTRHRAGARRSARGRSRRPAIRTARFIAFMAVLLAAFTLGTMMHAFAGNDRAAERGEPAFAADYERPTAVTVTVMPGDTLWDIASVHAPKGASLQKYISEMRRLNNLDTPVIYVGQLLQLP